MGKRFIDLDSAVLDRCNQKYYDKKLIEFGIGYTQFVLLSKVYENEGMMMNELAICGSYDKGTVTKAIAKLEELGLITLENSEEDKRAKKLYTTSKTKDLMPKLYQIRQEWLNYLSSEMTDEEENLISKIFDKIVLKAREYSNAEIRSEEIHFYGIQKLTLLDYPGKMAATVFTGGCNFRCPFCHNKNLVFLSQSETEIPKQEILDYLKQRKNLLDGVCVTGGEPMLHEGLEEFLKEVKSYGLSVKLDTNGTNSTKLKDLVDKGLVDYVAMDIKNEKDKYPETVGLNNYQLNEIEKSVNYLKEGHVDYEFRTTLVKEYHENTDYKKLGELVKGCPNYYLQNFEDHGSCIKEGLHALEVEKIKEIKEALIPYVNNISIRGIDEEEK